MRKTVVVLLVAVLLGAVSAVFCACNDAEINARNYAAAAQLVLSVLIDGYNQLEYDTEDGELHVNFAVERGENDRGRIDIDMRTGEITGMSMESGRPLNELLAKYDEYEYEPETAAAMRTEYEEKGGYYVRLGFKEAVSAERFLSTYYPQLWDYLSFAPLDMSTEGDYASGYWFSQGKYVDFSPALAAALGINAFRMEIAKPYDENARKYFMPAERYEEIVLRFGDMYGIYGDELVTFAAGFMNMLSGGARFSFGDYNFSHERGTEKVLGFSLVWHKASILNLLDSDDNLYIAGWR